MEAKIKMVQQKNKLRHYEDNILINNAQRDKKEATLQNEKRKKETRGTSYDT